MQRNRLALVGMAAVLSLAAQGVATLHAAEPLAAAQPASPRALAQRVRTLTEGGLFDPARASPAEWDRLPAAPAIPLGRDSG